MTCIHCGAKIDSAHTACPACGGRLVRTPRVGVSVAQASESVVLPRRPSSQREGTPRQQGRAGSRPLAAPARPGSRPPDKPFAHRESPPPAHSGSMPPSSRAGSASARPAASRPGAAEAETRGLPRAPSRMIRHHQYEAIGHDGPGHDRFNWIRLIVVSFFCVVILTVGAYYFLANSAAGQLWLASIGREATMEAYHELGRRYMIEGSISRAVQALEIAQSKDPNHLEVLVDLGRAYIGNNQVDQAQVAFTRAIQYWPAYPEPYRLLMDIMLEQGRDYEALQLAAMAMEETGGAYDDFRQTYQRLLPATPSASKMGGRYDKEFEITLTWDADCVLYYTLDKDKDPVSEGEIYSGPIYLEEGAWRLRAVAERDGIYSNELSLTYIINKPIPDPPKASLASGTYDTVKNVSLRPGGKDPVDIYYTIDGTEPTVESKRFDPETPIALRVGKTTIRAIAVNVDGKISKEMSITYECNGRTATSMEEKDVIGSLSLYRTTQAEFIEAYGAPLSQRSDGENASGAYTRLDYPFGYAVFLDRDNGKEPILAELSTKSTAFSGPRSTGIGTRMEDVLKAFRDVGGEENTRGVRILYNLTNGRLGLLTRLEDESYQISYYCKLDNGQYIELTYYAQNGLVVQMDWLRYDTK